MRSLFFFSVHFYFTSFHFAERREQGAKRKAPGGLIHPSLNYLSTILCLKLSNDYIVIVNKIKY